MSKTSSKWVGAIVIVILILAGIQWAMNVREENKSSTKDASKTATTTTSVVQKTKTETVTETNKNNSIKNLMHKITIETNKGKIVFESYDADAPKAVNNFITLANKGFYNGTIFHRVISGFMIQGGDPTGTGTGGPGYQFEDELNPNTDSYKAGYVRGTVAMANSGPNTNGSQFFIMHKDYPLPHNYTIFGKVVEGMNVVDAIASSATDRSDRPKENIVMNKVTVEEVK
jgi:cyclophilin family peptidyl-prolyl cis-trans isomerase